MPRTRTFISVELTPAIRDRIIGLQSELARLGTEVKWTEPENLHVTLIFLGEVDNRELGTVHRLATQAVGGIGEFHASFEDVGCFPNVRRPRVLWVGMKQGVEEMQRVHAALEEPLTELGYRREERRYVPHVTLGRVRSEPETDKLARGLHQYLGWKAGEMDVRELHVMSSELTRSGPLYTVLGRVRL